jgi:myo-inositol-1(or 4)-monophosphatase
VEESRLVQRAHRVALECARSAGSRLLKRFKNRDFRVQSFSEHDIKLDVDVDAENLIKSIIRRRFPDHGFICEESGEENIQGGYNWVIDPLDGTVNFSKGIPHFCTSIAFKREKRVLLGVVFDPVKDELFSGVLGEGATFNGKPIRRDHVRRLEEAVMVMGFFKTESLEEGVKAYGRIAHRVKKMRFFGSAALDLCYLACGRVNAYMQHSLNEWDIAAAALIADLSGVMMQIRRTGQRLNVIGSDVEIFDDFSSLVGKLAETDQTP